MAKKKEFDPAEYLISEILVDIGIMAGALIVEERIVNEDSRSMVQEIIQLSKQFQEGFDPSDENSDYMLAVDAFAEAELLARYSPEALAR